LFPNIPNFQMGEIQVELAFLSVEEVATILQVSNRTVRNIVMLHTETEKRELKIRHFLYSSNS